MLLNKQRNFKCDKQLAAPDAVNKKKARCLTIVENANVKKIAL